MPIERKAWSQEELLLVFRLYCRTSFGRLHQRNPEIIELARQIGRTPGAVAMKACNFASLDPQQQERRIKALGNVRRADRELWEAFLNDSESVAQEAEAVYVTIAGKESDDYLPELGYAEESMSRKISQKKIPSRKGLKTLDGPTKKETLVKAPARPIFLPRSHTQLLRIPLRPDRPSDSRTPHRQPYHSVER